MVGKKKRGHPDVEELLARPWCYYCERDFDDLKILISHQKAKHFKCDRCGRRLNTAGGLSVHMNQVHKEQLTSVDNSLPNRQNLDVEIFGMEGIPEDIVQAHNQRIIAGFYQAEAERRAATGNPGPGNTNQGGPKKPKFESPAEIKKRLAEHKARKAELAANGGSGGNTPLMDTPVADSPGGFAASPYTAPQASYGNTQGAGFGQFSQEPYSQPTAAYSQSFPQQPGFSGPPGAQPQYAPAQPYSNQAPPPGYQPPPQNFQAPPGQYNAGSPPGSFSNNYNAPPSFSPPGAGLPNRPQNAPPAPGLPQRPSFGAPVVAPYQMQQMHQGSNSPYNGQQQGNWSGNGWNGQENSAMSSAPPSHGYSGGYATNAPGTVAPGTDATAREDDDIDAIIRKIEARNDPAAMKNTSIPAAIPAVVRPTSTEQTPVPEITDQAPTATDKKSKKDKAVRMMYSDTEFSPEERMAKMLRYAFVPEEKAETALVDASTLPGVAGVVDA